MFFKQFSKLVDRNYINNGSIPLLNLYDAIIRTTLKLGKPRCVFPRQYYMGTSYLIDTKNKFRLTTGGFLFKWKNIP